MKNTSLMAEFKGTWSTWGTGLSKTVIANIKEDGWQGNDQLGTTLTQIMHELFDEPEDWSIPRRTVSMGYTPPGTPPPEPLDYDISHEDTIDDADDEVSQDGEKNVTHSESDADSEPFQAKSNPMPFALFVLICDAWDITPISLQYDRYHV